MDRLRQQLAFLMEIDKQKEIIRQTYLADGSRKETDAEHAWHLAMMCMILSEYANEKIDVPKTIMMVLTHDLVEIDAGDTYAYDEQAKKTQKAREDAAKEKIYSLLPEDQKQELIALFDEFEDNETPEARYAHAMDNLQPLLLNHSNDGGDWIGHQVTAEQVYGRQRKTRLGSETLFQVSDAIIRENMKKGYIRED